MLRDVSHLKGIQKVDEILFETPFGYMFPFLSTSPDCLLPVDANTIPALMDLGNAMGDPGNQDRERKGLNSRIPAIFTYLGQFIDHDITARTDRDDNEIRNRIEESANGKIEVNPIDPADVVRVLKNGRRPQLDLDSVYGDGPGLLFNPKLDSITEADALYNGELKFKVRARRNRIDLPRHGRKALIADMRNDENVIISQLHAAFLRFHNKVVEEFKGSEEMKYIRARQLVRWAYQYVVVNDYLPNVCDRNIVKDTLFNGPRFYAPGFSGGAIFMPLEFSAAAFRFGHSMIRPFYELNDGTQKNIEELLGVANEERRAGDDLLEEINDKNYRLKDENVVSWSKFASFKHLPKVEPQRARRIDPLLAEGLFQLQNIGEGIRAGSILAMLAQRNLVRAFVLSIPHGQAVAGAMGVVPLRKGQLFDGISEDTKKALKKGGFVDRTPLWYYILREAEVQQNGQSLGEVGSRLVAETLIGLVKQDPNSYLNNLHEPAVKDDGIVIKGSKIATIADLLKFAEVPI